MNKTILDEAIDFVSGYVGNVTDWVTIKKELLKTLSPADRIYFSTRDPITKKQRVNDFEKVVAERWHQKTGNKPIFKNYEE